MIYLDTHIVAWLYSGLVKNLSTLACDQIEKNDVYISQMVRLELQYLKEINRISTSPEKIINELSRSIGLKATDRLGAHVYDYAIGYDWTRDVFDRLITAEADAMKAGLITKDTNIRAYYGNAIW